MMYSKERKETRASELNGIIMYSFDGVINVTSYSKSKQENNFFLPIHDHFTCSLTHTSHLFCSFTSTSICLPRPPGNWRVFYSNSLI